MSNQTASWSVHDSRHASNPIDDNNLEALLKVVDEPENEEMHCAPRHESFVARAGGYTKATQVFSALAPAEIGGVTPVKDPMESFNAWARGQTPTSNRSSPTPTGGFLGVPRGVPHTPISGALGGLGVNANRHLNMNVGPNSTPAKLGASPTRGPGLEAIQEHRRQLLQQMEELELQELELRNRHVGSVNNTVTPYGNQNEPPTSNALFSVQSRQPFSQGLNPFAASFGAPTSAQPQPQMTAESIRGRVYETAKDQHGCRFLQRALDSNYDREMAQVIMNEIVPYVPELMTDQYANFLVQKLFDMMPHDVRFNVAKVAAPQMPKIALTPHGTFSVQKLIETITTREEMLVVRDALSADVVRLVVDVHGNHVIQKVLQRFDHPDKQFIYDAVSTDCASIAMNKQGCCVLQRCLEYASPEQHKALVSTILDAALDVVEDPYGNYVVQYVLESDEVEINDRIGLMFLPAISRLAINKFSSNVMERVLRRTSQHVKDKYCEALCDINVATRLLSDDYGNYVVQTALTTGSPQHVETLTQTIRPVLHTIRNAPYAKKLEAKMDMIGRKKFPPTGGGPRGGQAGGYRHFPSAAALPYAPMPPPPPPHHHHGMNHSGMGGMPPMVGGGVVAVADGESAPMGPPLTPYGHAPMQHRTSSNIPLMTAAQRTAIDAAMVDAIGGGAAGSVNANTNPNTINGNGGGGVNHNFGNVVNTSNNNTNNSNANSNHSTYSHNNAMPHNPHNHPNGHNNNSNNHTNGHYHRHNNTSSNNNNNKYTATTQIMNTNTASMQHHREHHVGYNASGNTYNTRYTDGGNNNTSNNNNNNNNNTFQSNTNNHSGNYSSNSTPNTNNGVPNLGSGAANLNNNNNTNNYTTSHTNNTNNNNTHHNHHAHGNNNIRGSTRGRRF